MVLRGIRGQLVQKEIKELKEYKGFKEFKELKVWLVLEVWRDQQVLLGLKGMQDPQVHKD